MQHCERSFYRFFYYSSAHCRSPNEWHGPFTEELSTESCSKPVPKLTMGRVLRNMERSLGMCNGPQLHNLSISHLPIVGYCLGDLCVHKNAPWVVGMRAGPVSLVTFMPGCTSFPPCPLLRRSLVAWSTAIMTEHVRGRAVGGYGTVRAAPSDSHAAAQLTIAMCDTLI